MLMPLPGPAEVPLVKFGETAVPASPKQMIAAPAIATAKKSAPAAPHEPVEPVLAGIPSGSAGEAAVPAHDIAAPAAVPAEQDELKRPDAP